MQRPAVEPQIRPGRTGALSWHFGNGAAGRVWHAAAGYALAMTLLGLACLLRWGLPQVLADTPYLAFYPAVVAAAGLGGLGPGLSVTVGSFLCVHLIFDDTPGRIDLGDPVLLGRMAVFLAGGIGISLASHMSRNAQTRERRHASELRESEARFRGTFENAAVGIAHLDAQGRFLRVNEKLRQILGYRCEEVRGMHFADLSEPQTTQTDLAKYPRLMRGELPTYAVEKRYLRRDGQGIWVRVTRSVQRDDGGQPAYSIAIVEDITQRKLAEQQLKELNETLERRVAERTAEVERQVAQLRAMTTELTLAEHRERQRIAKVLHDHLQQLLVGARFNMATAQAQIADPQVRESLDFINKLLDDSVSATRSLTTELFPPILHAGTFAEALRWLIRWMREKHDLQVHLKADDGMEPQAEEIRLVLFEATRELLFNIVKHAGVREACLEMAQHDGDRVRITIADSGKGFDVASLRPADRTEGGFGMTSIRQRLRLLGGQIEIQSTPGHGTRATLVAPLRPADGDGGADGMVNGTESPPQ